MGACEPFQHKLCVLTDIYTSIFVTHSDKPDLKSVHNKTNPTRKSLTASVAVSTDRIYESWLGPNPCLEND